MLASKKLPQIIVSLKNKNFRLYFCGMCISLTGNWMQQIAMSWLAYRLTGSVLLLATITLMSQLPILFLAPFTSVFVDRYNRKTILLITQLLSMLQATILGLLTLENHIEIYHILSLSLLLGIVNALDNPARQALYPTLVPKKEISNAIALNSAIINGSRLIGPAIGGFVIGITGEGWCFILNALSYIGVIFALLLIENPQELPQQRKDNILTGMYEGIKYIKGNPVIGELLIMMSCISFFGLPLTTFIPAFTKDILHGSSEMLGGLMTCTGIGSLIAAFYLAQHKDNAKLGKVIINSGLFLSFTLVALSASTNPWISAILCIPAGFTMIAIAASINTLLQVITTDQMRGRIMGYMAMTFTGINPLGSMFFGSMEKYISLPGIILLSGVLCLISTVGFAISQKRIPILTQK